MVRSQEAGCRFFFILSIVLQALLIVHCIKTGRNTIWIWVIALLSYAGIVAYVAVEVLPDLFAQPHRAARRARREEDARSAWGPAEVRGAGARRRQRRESAALRG